MKASQQGITALGARVHLFVRPRYCDEFISLFRSVLGCAVADKDFGLAYPIMLVSFSDGSSFSVEFSELAPEDIPGDTMDDGHAFRGPWIEFRTTDVPGYQQKLREAGIRDFRHPRQHPCIFQRSRRAGVSVDRRSLRRP
jgi:hypothetical protein